MCDTRGVRGAPLTDFLSVEIQASGQMNTYGGQDAVHPVRRSGAHTSAGGACVAVYTDGSYVSKDADGRSTRAKGRKAVKEAA